MYTPLSIFSSIKTTLKSLLVMTFILSFSISFAQTSDITKAKQILSERGEIEFSFRANSDKQFQEIASFLSIDHGVSLETLNVNAFANTRTFEKFLTYNVPFNLKTDYDVSFIHTETVTRDPWDGDNSWDSYPTYTEYVSTMNDFVTNYPTLCTLEVIGTTTNGRNLYVLKISDNASIDEAEPEFFFTSSMHGDEIAGFPLMIHLIDELLSNYGTDSEITNLVNSTEIFINPSANPDGSYDGGNSNVISSPTRSNANGVDLNRNYPDPDDGIHSDGEVYQLETLAFMAFQAQHNFVISANFHGGVEVMNYPWDTYNPGNSATGGSTSIPNPENYHPYTDYFELISNEYADLAQLNGPGGYMNYDPDNSTDGTPNNDGVTNGALWYVVAGGRQDYATYYENGREVTIEISDTKQLAGANLPAWWTANRQAFLNYMKQVNYGIQGIITDSETGNPVEAYVYVASKHKWNTGFVSSSLHGDYYKTIEAGTFSITVEAPCYVSQTITGISVSNFSTTVQNVSLVPLAEAPTSGGDVTIDTGNTADITATASGTVNWYDAATGGTLVGTGSPFTTPILTSTTSYFAENTVTPSSSFVTTPSNNSNGGFLGGNRYIEFDVFQDIHLDKVTINAQSSGSITVNLLDADLNTVDSQTVSVVSGIQDITLNFDIPRGLNYRLQSNLGVNLYRNNSNVSYPYELPGKVIIKNSGAGTGFYYAFYDWELTDTDCISNRTEVVVTVNVGPCPGGTTEYTGAGWSNGAPDATTEAIISVNYSTTIASIDACTLTINNGATLTVIAGTYVNVEGDITVNVGGELDVLHEGSVVQVDNNSQAINNGTITVRKTTPSLGAKDFMILGNPMTLETREGVYGAGRLVLHHITANFIPHPGVESSFPGTENFADNNGNNWGQHNGLLTLGEGYLVRPQPTSSSTGAFNLDYTLGTLNNGTINFTVGFNGTQNGSANMLGNPYASAIDTDAFLAANAMIDAVYFWEHITPPSDTYPGFNQFNFNMGDLSAYNAGSGGVAAANGGTAPTQFMASGQGFGIKASAAGTAVFNNSMRVTGPNTDYKNYGTTTRQRIWLHVTNNTYKLSSNILVAFVEGATDRFESYYDTKRMGTPVSLYSILDSGKELSIQGRTVFTVDQEVRLGFSTMIEENQSYTISISDIEGVNITNTSVYLEDKELQTFTNLSEENYSFIANAGTQENRFVLLFKEKVLDINENELLDDSILIYPNPTSANITIRNTTQNELNTITVFDLQGRQVINVTLNNSFIENSINVANLPAGVYMIQIKSGTNVIVKRLIKE